MIRITANPGNKVICDLCGGDYTHSTQTGGILFNSNAVCPECLPKFIESVKRYNEEKYIRAEALKNETFKDFVLRIRKGIHLN